MNQADVFVDLRDVYGHRIQDEVVLAFHNLDVTSYSSTYHLELDGKPGLLKGVPAFPTGNALVDIKPSRYQQRRVRISVVGPSVGSNTIKEDFFVDPGKASPPDIMFTDLKKKSYWSQLKRLLKDSTPSIDGPTWDNLEPVNRATILNLCSKMVRESAGDGKPIIEHVSAIDTTWLDLDHRERIYSPVSGNLLTLLRNLPDNFKRADGSTHHFPHGWSAITTKPFSFKTEDRAGNIQFTFASDAANNSYCDIDLDDHSGIQHAIDYLEHKIFQEETHPYTIHELLVKYQKHGDPEYRLL